MTIEAQIEHQIWPHIQVRSGLPEGRVFFSTSSIYAGEIICDYGGRLLEDRHPIVYNHETSKFLFEIDWKFCKHYLYFAPNDPNLSFGALMNHSLVHPNTHPRLYFIGGKPAVLFLALTNIPAGIELLWNYGPEYENVRPCVASCPKCGKCKKFTMELCLFTLVCF